MAALSERKIEVVRTLVETAPDRIVGGLQAALADTTPGSALASVRRLVEHEASERRLRNWVLQPIAPMCVGDGRAPDTLTFPARVLPLIWRGLTARCFPLVEQARAALQEHLPDEPPPEVLDDLLRAAAKSLRARDLPEFQQAADICEAARPGGADVLISCIEIAPVVRTATVRLPEWLARFDESSTAAARLAYKDAVAISDDAGPRFFEMLSAQMSQHWMILRVICEVMDKPTERYLADSEMAFFGERVMGEVDDALKAIGKLDLDAGPGVGRAAGKRVELVTQQIHELETCMDLNREHGWGLRIAKQRKGLASVVEGRLRDAEKHVKDALASQSLRIARMQRYVPRLGSPPEPLHVARALTLLNFVEEVRASANYGGFASARAKVIETLAGYIDNYVEEVLDLIKTGEAESIDNSLAFLEVAAQFNQLVQGDKAAELVRRRAVVARSPDMPVAAGG
jgi:hypothetical protein